MSTSPQHTGREAVLSRVREALRTQTSTHVKHAEVPLTPASPDEFGESLPPVPADREGLIALFADRSAALKTEFEIFGNREDLSQRLRSLANENAWKRVGWNRHLLVTPLVEGIGLEQVCTSSEYDPDLLERCDAGITTCDALVAQSGSVLVTSVSTGGRALTVLPPHHVVVATADQVVPDLPAAYALVAQRYADNMPSMVSIITGPSRTGDIERILVLGAHGPKRLSVLLLQS
jgi:L-lactate dehydrogenase complex protein LldG